MILLDSSVVIDLFRAQDDRILDVILEHDAAICGITRAEVLYGARDASQRDKLMAALDLFQSLALPETIWDRVGDNLARFRTSGVTVPLADAIIATVAMTNNIELWARDQHFLLIKQTMPSLMLFQERS
jgi:predicted nucleic acid-binding protein